MCGSCGGCTGACVIMFEIYSITFTTGMCTSMCTGMCTSMCTGMCTSMCIGMCTSMCTGMCTSMSVLLCACETWKTTNQITRLQTFINKCLRRITNTKWTDKITNEELWRITKQKPIEIQTKRKKWNWIGHTVHKEAEAIEKTTLDWNPQGYRRRGRPENVVKGNRG